MLRKSLMTLVLLVASLGLSLAGGPSVISDGTQPIGPGLIQDGSDTLPHATLRVTSHSTQTTARGEVIRWSSTAVWGVCDENGSCPPVVSAACYDNISDCRDTADSACSGLQGSATGERLTSCNVDGQVVACCEITCATGPGTSVTVTCTQH
jgi:hypothetical protein